ncbi:MAG: hypothetical protein K8F91_21650, partial [Candidatus Obscuribacterales bacterium]|nr:hypothetical protein [Candidatus Obscuribacterales bacterium]
TRFGDDIVKLSDNVGSLLGASTDNLAAKQLTNIVDQIAVAKAVPNLANNVASSLDDLDRAVTGFAKSTDKQAALAQIERSVQTIAKADPKLGAELGKLVTGLDDAVKLGANLGDESARLTSRVVESVLPRRLDELPKLIDDASKQARLVADDIGKGADDLSLKVKGNDATSQLIRQELASISRNSKGLIDESTDAARASQMARDIELSVRRVSEIAGPGLQDDIARLAQNSRALSRTTQKATLAEDLLRLTADNTSRLTTNLAEHSNSISQGITRLETKAIESLPAKTARVVQNELDELSRATNRIASGVIDDATIKQARTALANLEKTGANFGDDLTRLADDTQRLITTAQQR